MSLITMHEHDILYIDDIIDFSKRSLLPSMTMLLRKAVLRIRISVLFGILDPDPVVRGMDPDQDPSIIKQDSYCFLTSLGLFIFEK
jgi:hypothetical protein